MRTVEKLANTFPAPVNGNGKGRLPACPAPSLFRSFWMGGFECACQINTRGVRLDMTAALGHDVNAAEDYALLRSIGISAARDGIRWHLVDRCGRYDFSSWDPMAEAARREGVQVLWDLCHYGWPDDVDIFTPAFVDRFARFCRAVARRHRETSDETAFYTPVNEISFFAWAACRKIMFPFARRRDGDLKRQLVRAAIAGIEGIWDADRNARIIFVEPLIHIVPPRGKADELARAKHESQFEAWDMLIGRAHPDLGGNPKYLDIMGLNYYASNQWEVPGGKKLRWAFEPLDDRWKPLYLLLEEVYRRYHRPLFIAETSHYGAGRAAWINEIAGETRQARKRGVPIEGVCLYPILDRFDWNHPRHWHHSGVFDMVRNRRPGDYRRVLNPEAGEALAAARKSLARLGCQ